MLLSLTWIFLLSLATFPLVEAIPVEGLLPVVEASERKWICEELDTFPAERLL